VYRYTRRDVATAPRPRAAENRAAENPAAENPAAENPRPENPGAEAFRRDAPTLIGYLAIAGSVITFLGYFTLLKTWSVTSLSFISVFTPAIALILGFVFLDERPTIANGVGGALILGGVALALTERTPVTQGAR